MGASSLSSVTAAAVRVISALGWANANRFDGLASHVFSTIIFFLMDTELPAKAAIKFSFCVVARYLTENRRFEQQNPVKIKCSQLNCDQPQKEDLIASLGLNQTLKHTFFEL